MAPNRSPNSPARGSWTAKQVDDLGLHIDVATAASVLGIGRTTAYRLIRAKEFPIPVLHLGRRVRVPVAALRRYLSGLDAAESPERQSR